LGKLSSACKLGGNRSLLPCVAKPENGTAERLGSGEGFRHCERRELLTPSLYVRDRRLSHRGAVLFNVTGMWFRFRCPRTSKRTGVCSRFHEISTRSYLDLEKGMSYVSMLLRIGPACRRRDNWQPALRLRRARTWLCPDAEPWEWWSNLSRQSEFARWISRTLWPECMILRSRLRDSVASRCPRTGSHRREF